MFFYFASRILGAGLSAYRARQERRATTDNPWLYRSRIIVWWAKRTLLAVLMLALSAFLFGQIATAIRFPLLWLAVPVLPIHSWRRYPSHHVKPRLVSEAEASEAAATPGPQQAEQRDESTTVPAYVTRLPDGTIQIFPWQGSAQ